MTAGSELERLLSRYGIVAESECAHRFRVYLDLLQKWNRRINLVSSTTWETLGPLFEEGLWASRFYPQGAVRHLDVGSGAGFPAVPIRLLNDGMSLRMVESRAKRAVFLETAVESLGMATTRVLNCTLETFLNKEGASGGWDCVSWKAIRLDGKSFSSLVTKADSGATFWVFHGEHLPVEGCEPHTLLRRLRFDSVPGKPSWHLSIFEKRLVSRETIRH